jgi:hypothetical protein
MHEVLIKLISSMITEGAGLTGVEDCRTRAFRPPQTHVSYKAVDGPAVDTQLNQIFHTQFHQLGLPSIEAQLRGSSTDRHVLRSTDIFI